jgi:hypothetical protein
MAAARLLNTQRSWDLCSSASNGSPLMCSMLVIHHENWVQRHTLCSAASE